MKTLQRPLIVIIIALTTLFWVNTATAQQTLVDEIKLLRTTDPSPEVAGPILHQILEEMKNLYPSECAKKQLLNTSARRIEFEGAYAEKGDGKILRLLFYTRNKTIPAKTTNSRLREVVEMESYQEEAIHAMNRTNTVELLRVLENYPPEESARWVDIIARPWFSGTRAQDYTKRRTSVAAESLWQIYYDTRMVELAKMSTVVKLLEANGFIHINQITYANFWPKGGSMPIDLDQIVWLEADRSELERLNSNPYYASMAFRQLERMP